VAVVSAVPAPPPNQGITDTLEEARAARYEQVKRGE
jgi:hypothetical protein